MSRGQLRRLRSRNLSRNRGEPLIRIVTPSQKPASFEHDRLEYLLQFWALKRVNPIVGSEEGEHKRDAEVRHRQVREQKLGCCARPSAYFILRRASEANSFR
eukprot:3314301-Prymnesium_polylepis.1